MKWPIGQPPFQWQGEINQESEQLSGLVRWFPNFNAPVGNGIIDKALGKIVPFPSGSAQQPSWVIQPVAEQIGRTLSFVATSYTDANRDYVSFDAVSLGTEQTFSYWCAYNNYSAQAYGGLVLGYTNDYYFDWISGTTRYAVFGSGGVTSVTSTMTKGKLEHLAISRSGTAVQFYLNGKPDGAVQTLGANNALTLSIIGAATTTPNSYYGLNGTLADIRIYNRALAAQEIWQLYEPQTRWQLYAMPSPKYWFVAAATTSIIPLVRHHMLQQGMA